MKHVIATFKEEIIRLSLVKDALNFYNCDNEACITFFLNMPFSIIR